MEYERIEKVQTGLISPSKLRMKLMGSHNLRREGSRCNSSRTSPSKLDDSDFVRSGLLSSDDSELKKRVGDAGTAPDTRKNEVSTASGSAGRPKNNGVLKGDAGNPHAVYPGRAMEDENLDYDSNASSSSFEFHRGERSSVHHHVPRSGSRQMSSKWNDAEKWIMSKQQNASASYWKKTLLQGHTNRMGGTGSVKITPEQGGGNHRPLVAARGYEPRRVENSHPTDEMGLERFAFVLATGTPSSCQASNSAIGNSQGRDLVDTTQPVAEESSGITTIREVSMRDMGTEMTPATSLEPSRTATPVGSATPLQSPTSSIPSTPRRDTPAPTPTDEEAKYPPEFYKRELTEEELKLKTRREIVALGVQLGKMSIAAWASQEESEKNVSPVDAAETEERERLEYERRAAAWEEAEKNKHTARYKREEIRIQAWESQQKAKLEAELRKIEARVDQMRAQAQAKMVQKIAMARQRSDERRAAAVARKKRDAKRTAAQAEYIRQTRRIPSSPHMCWGGFAC
ncbi:hypothetical protein MLD38_010349 [Melastoma candidum]|uniref:Uncharacterized protein n=1 Tax=Melastoma candidum TaxID=119954 RepID=A0ACB9R7V8_9MYRT|nr:hypothetical protein MLD38_010349 [Melastoma candidum]